MALTWPQFAAIKDKHVLLVVKAAALREHNDENFDFYFDKRDNKKLYQTYISEDAPRQVNLPDKMRRALDDLARQNKWSAMNAGMQQAKAAAAGLVDSETIRRLKADPNGEFMLAAALMGLDGVKAKQAMPFIQVCAKPRSPGDLWQAYQALLKLASKAKVDATLKAMGAPPPAKAPDEKAAVADNLKLDKDAKKVRDAMPDTLKYYASALSYLQKNGPPKDRVEANRMFESGRMRHDKIHLPYTELVRRDKDFVKKYKEIAELKKKVDTAWAEMRQKMGK